MVGVRAFNAWCMGFLVLVYGFFEFWCTGVVDVFVVPRRYVTTDTSLQEYFGLGINNGKLIL